MKPYLILPALSLFLFSACAVNTVVEAPELPAPSEIIAEENSPAEWPSLPALFAKKFDGRDLVLGDILAQNAAYTRYYITYKSGELTISGIMNVPAGEGPFPVLILNHGHIDTAVYTNGRGLKREQDYFARNGYVVIHPDYRNHAASDKDPENEYNFRLGYTADAVNAVYAVKESALSFLDQERIGMLGHSMGGGVTQNVLVTEPGLVQAAVLFAPVSGDVRDNFERWTTRRPEIAKVLIERYQMPEGNPEFWSNLSPRNFFDRISAPVLIHHGTADDDVPLEWSERIATALENAGKEVILHIYEGEPHEFAAAWPEVMRKSVEFFDAHVKEK